MKSVETLNDGLKSFLEVKNRNIFRREVCLNIVKRYLRLIITIFLNASIVLRTNLYHLPLFELFLLWMTNRVFKSFLIRITHYIKILISFGSDSPWVIADRIVFRAFSIYKERSLNRKLLILINVVTSLHKV